MTHTYNSYIAGLPLERRVEIIHTLLRLGGKRVGEEAILESASALQEHERQTLVVCVYAESLRTGTPVWISSNEEFVEDIVRLLMSNPLRAEYCEALSDADATSG